MKKNDKKEKNTSHIEIICPYCGNSKLLHDKRNQKLTCNDCGASNIAPEACIE